MTDELNSQLSAFVDDELSPEEAGLLVRRLCRDEALRHTAACYSLIGNVLRGDAAIVAPEDFSKRVMMAVEGQTVPARTTAPVTSRAGRRMSIAIAASVALAAVALMTLPPRAPDDGQAVVADLATEVAAVPVDPLTDVVALTDLAGPAVLTALPQGPGGVSPVSYNVPMVIPANRHTPETRARLNNYLVRHLRTTGTRQNLVTYRNVGFVRATDAER